MMGSEVGFRAEGGAGRSASTVLVMVLEGWTLAAENGRNSGIVLEEGERELVDVPSCEVGGAGNELQGLWLCV